VAAVAAAVACLTSGVLLAVGCGDGPDDADSVRAREPVVTFAPLVLLHPAERWYPLSPGRYLDRVALWWANDGGCPNAKIAPTAALRPSALGRGSRRYRQLQRDPHCTADPQARFATGDVTRPYHVGDGRDRGLGDNEGFYLQPERGAWRIGTEPDFYRTIPTSVPAYYETASARVEGADGLRIAYWLFYAAAESTWIGWREGVSSKPGGTQRVWENERIGRTGDWQRVEVLVRREGGAYVPVTLRTHVHGRVRDVPWEDVQRTRETHPVVYAAHRSHTPYVRAGFHETSVRRLVGNSVVVDDAASCRGCPRWPTWRRLRDARAEPWYGYGGAWGAEGDSNESAGSLGPGGSSRGVGVR
jgi:hypothetical protein